MAKRTHRAGIHEAKTHLSRLLRDVENGAEVIVERGGRPIIIWWLAADSPLGRRQSGAHAG
jgi:hypothetical protein